MITVYVTCTVVVYSVARCKCGRRLLDVPGQVFVEVRTLSSESQRSGRGPTLICPRCKDLCEVIEHRKAA